VDALRLPSVLEASSRVLVAGAGGGFDVYAGIPLYERLRAAGKEAFFANLSFTYLGGTDAERLGRSLHAVRATTSGGDAYFPERALARFYASRGRDLTVYAFDKMGVVPVRDGYERLVRDLDLDAVVLVDGGTDILLRGDESGLGTPVEDMTSLAAAFALEDIATKLVMCVGFGIDSFHGVCHAHWLENVAALTREGAFLGAAALRREMPEVATYLDAVAHADEATPDRPSIVNGSIASALEGRFGDHHRSDRTRGSTLFVNPLMTLLWAFDLHTVARRNLYLRELATTETVWDVQAVIQAFHRAQAKRPRAAIPH
jgi:hypothetical protein